MELDMTKGRPVTLIVRFMIPLIIGNVFQQLYNMVDTIIVGQYIGVDALAAVGAVGNIMFLILGFLMGLTAGFTVITAQRFGAGDVEGLKKSVVSAIFLSVIVTVVITAASMAFMNPLLQFMHTPENIFGLSKSYIMIICGGMCFGVMYNLASGILRALGNSKVPLYSLIASAFLNIILDLFFIIVIPWGVAGAALATVLSQAAAGMICVIYMIKRLPRLLPDKSHWQWERHTALQQLKIGIPMALQFSITAIGAILVQSALNLLGSVAVAAYTTAVKAVQLMGQPQPAIGMTLATFSAQNRGVNNFVRIRQGAVIANWMSSLYSVMIYGVLLLTFPYILHLFVRGTDYQQVYEYARIYVIIAGASLVPLGFINIYRNVLQSCGYSLIPTLGGVMELVSRSAIALVAVKNADFIAVCVADGGTWLVTGFFLWISYLFIFRKKYGSQSRTNSFSA